MVNGDQPDGILAEMPKLSKAPRFCSDALTTSDICPGCPLFETEVGVQEKSIVCTSGAAVTGIWGRARSNINKVVHAATRAFHVRDEMFMLLAGSYCIQGNESSYIIQGSRHRCQTFCELRDYLALVHPLSKRIHRQRRVLFLSLHCYLSMVNRPGS